MRLLYTLLFLLPTVFAWAQTPLYGSLDNVQPTSEYDNIHVAKLHTDPLVSSFVIWVKKEVKLHKHADHSEHVLILEGSGNMTLGDDEFELIKGMMIYIPKGMAHSVQVTSKKPLKVLSIQAPEFTGKDRIMLKD